MSLLKAVHKKKKGKVIAVQTHYCCFEALLPCQILLNKFLCLCQLSSFNSVPILWNATMLFDWSIKSLLLD